LETETSARALRSVVGPETPTAGSSDAQRRSLRAAIKTYHGTHQGTFLGVAPTDRKIYFDTVDAMCVHNGEITEHWGATNVSSLMQQLEETLMTLEQIKTQPDPYEPFLLSQGIRVGEFLFISGQAGYANDGRIVEGGFRAQGEQAFSNLKRALVAGGASLKNVVKVTIFVTGMGNFNEIVGLRRKFFSAPYPADSIVEVSGLYAPEALIEIEAIATVT
jgi:2-iminobutanoate/2-iminopropanoate deaminase